jgi:hypothetical protein
VSKLETTEIMAGDKIVLMGKKELKNSENRICYKYRTPNGVHRFVGAGIVLGEEKCASIIRGISFGFYTGH